MSLAAFFIRTAANHLRRGGQRVVVALLCIAFGVMSLVSMMLVSSTLERTMVVAPREIIGADITAGRLHAEAGSDAILPEHVQALEALRVDGQIERYTLAAYSSSIALRLPEAGADANLLILPGSGLGIDPAAYPLAGSLIVGAPGNVGAQTLLQEPGDVLVTNDLLANYDLHVGDAVILSDLQVGATLAGRVRGIVTDTPNHQGSRVYYNAASAERLAGGAPYWNTALILAKDPPALVNHLNESGWQAYEAAALADGDAYTRALITSMLNGAGMLGLMVGGIGIANTMQVLLNRRRKEIAVWKTIGYRTLDLYGLFACEALCLGVAGSLVGAGLGVLVSRGLMNLFHRTSTMLFDWQVSPAPVLTGLAVGVATTLIFSMLAIVLASRVPPLGLLRSEALHPARMPWAQALGLAVLLALPLLGVTSLVMGSLLGGLGMLAVMAAGLVGLGALLAGLVWLVTRLLPLRGWPLANLARNNLRRRGWGLVFAMIALFAGVVALALSVVVTQNALQARSERSVVLDGDNLMLIAPQDQSQAISAALDGLSPQHRAYGALTPVESVSVEGLPDVYVSPLLIARDEPADFELSGAAWGSQPDGVYVDQYSGIELGSALVVTALDGARSTYRVAGYYVMNYMTYGPRPAEGVLLPLALSQDVGAPSTAQFFARVPGGQIRPAAEQLSRALPQVTVIDLLAYATRFTRQYQNLFVFAAAMAGLALLAGVLLLANSVSLAMLDRRYELGVFKAMGYARWHLLATLMVEYSLAALIAVATGLGAVRAYLWLMSLSNPLVNEVLVLTPSAVILIGGACLLLTLLTVLLTTWRSVQVAPVVVLNDRV